MAEPILMSIRPEYADQILDGTKTCEYRTQPCGLQTDGFPRQLVIYRSGPAAGRGIVAVADIDDVLHGAADNLWDTADRPGIKRQRLIAYAGRRPLWRFDLRNVRRLPDPVPLAEVGIGHAPQSWRYIPSATVRQLLGEPVDLLAALQASIDRARSERG